jgi:hypothetical protein
LTPLAQACETIPKAASIAAAGNQLRATTTYFAAQLRIPSFLPTIKEKLVIEPQTLIHGPALMSRGERKKVPHEFPKKDRKVQG